MKHSRKPPTIVTKKLTDFGHGKMAIFHFQLGNFIQFQHPELKGDLFFSMREYGKIKCFGIALKFMIYWSGSSITSCRSKERNSVHVLRFQGFFSVEGTDSHWYHVGSLNTETRCITVLRGRKWCDLPASGVAEVSQTPLKCNPQKQNKAKAKQTCKHAKLLWNNSIHLKKKHTKKNKTTHTVTYCRNNVTTCMSHRFEFACMFYESVRCIVFKFSPLHMLALVASTCFYYVKLDFFWHPNNVNLSPVWKNTAPADARCAWIHWKLETFDCPNRVQPTVPGKRRGPR